MLDRLDDSWKELLTGLGWLRKSIWLRGYAGKDPMLEYTSDAMELFGDFLDNTFLDTMNHVVGAVPGIKAMEKLQRESAGPAVRVADEEAA
jgi:preprotein translocase subunit SecA